MQQPIKQLNVEIYGGCNLACQMCPQAPEMGGREHNFKKKLPFDVFAKVVEDAKQHGATSVSLHGSGEPTLHPELPKMIRFVAERGMKPSFFTNGSRLSGRYFKELIDAGVDLITVSMVGADRTTYHKWMNRDSFDQVLRSLHECVQVLRDNPNRGTFHTRHLITDPDNKDEEIALHRRNIIDPLGCLAEIWMPHNWAGQYDTNYSRFDHVSKPLRTCGRPFAATLEVRAGGNDGHSGAVVPCPFVLGKDSRAVLGHVDTQTIDEVFADEPMQALQRAHREGRFQDIDYCRGCDMLVDDTEVLAWSNIPGRHVGQSKTSEVDYPKAGELAVA